MGTSLVAHLVKNLPAIQETRFDSQVGKIPWRREQLSTPVFLPGESQGRRSLVGCRLWGRTESDTTEATQQQQQQGASRVHADKLHIQKLPIFFISFCLMSCRLPYICKVSTSHVWQSFSSVLRIIPIVKVLSHILFLSFLISFFSSFVNCESMITYLQETWIIQNKVAYNSTIYYNYFLKQIN